MNPTWHNVQIERDGDIPPVHQIAHSIRHAIATSRLSSGETLPSVRQLARLLSVTPATVGRAYSILREEGLLHARTGSSTVVAELVDIEGAALRKSGEAALQLVGKTIDALLGMGLSVADIRHTFSQKLGELVSTRYVVFVAGSTPVVEKYRAIVDKELRPLGFAVHACRLDEFENASAELSRILDDTSLVICMLSFKRGVDAVLKSTNRTLPVSILLTEININTSAKLASVDPRSRILVIAEPEFRNITASLVRAHVPEDKVTVAIDMEPSSLVSAIRKADVVAYTLGCAEGLKAIIPPDTNTLLLEYNARQDSLERIKSALLAPDVRARP